MMFCFEIILYVLCKNTGDCSDLCLHIFYSYFPPAMSQLRLLAGVLRGRCTLGSLWLRGNGSGSTRRCLDSYRRMSSSGSTPVSPAIISSSSYVEEMYYAWLDDHKNVHKVTAFSYPLVAHLP